MARGGDASHVARVMSANLSWINEPLSQPGGNALYTASAFGRDTIAEWLLDNGADPDTAATYDGDNPLHLASKYGHLNCVRLLLQHGASTTARDRSGHEAGEIVCTACLNPQNMRNASAIHKFFRQSLTVVLNSAAEARAAKVAKQGREIAKREGAAKTELVRREAAHKKAAEQALAAARKSKERKEVEGHQRVNKTSGIDGSSNGAGAGAGAGSGPVGVPATDSVSNQQPGFAGIDGSKLEIEEEQHQPANVHHVSVGYREKKKKEEEEEEEGEDAIIDRKWIMSTAGGPAVRPLYWHANSAQETRAMSQRHQSKFMIPRLQQKLRERLYRVANRDHGKEDCGRQLSKAKVTRVERVENSMLWSSYCTAKDSLKERMQIFNFKLQELAKTAPNVELPADDVIDSSLNVTLPHPLRFLFG